VAGNFVAVVNDFPVTYRHIYGAPSSAVISNDDVGGLQRVGDDNDDDQYQCIDDDTTTVEQVCYTSVNRSLAADVDYANDGTAP